MKKNRGIVFFISAVCVALFSAGAFAQGAAPAAANAASPNRAPSPIRIGVIDYRLVLEAHPKFNAYEKGAAEQIQKAAAQFQTQEKSIADEQKNIQQTYTVGTQAFTEATQKLSQRLADLGIEKQQFQMKMAIDSARELNEAIDSINEIVETIAKQYGFSTIINSPQPDLEATNDVTVLAQMKIQMMQNIVWSTPSHDITNTVIGALNKRYANYTTIVDIQNGKRVVLGKAAAAPNTAGYSPAAPRPAGAADAQRPIGRPAPTGVPR